MLTDVVEYAAELIDTLVSNFGAPVISLIALLENLFPPIPSETLYPLTGKLAFDEVISIPMIVFAGVVGSVAGSLIYYFLGYRMGEKRMRKLIARYGTLKIRRIRITFLAVADYDRGLQLFRQRGTFIVFVGRLMPVVHGVVSIPAGVIRMNIWLFLLYTALGSALWILPLTLLGYWLGENWKTMLQWVDFYQNLLLGFLVAFFIFYIVRRFRNPKDEPPETPNDTL